MNFWLKFALVFACVTVTDACWAIYIIKASQKKAFSASVWGSLISALTSFTVIAYTEDHKFIIASILGAFVGTYLTIRYLNKK